MNKKINITGKEAQRIRDTGPTAQRINLQEFADALGAQPIGEKLSGDLDPISLGALGHELLQRLRSTGGRPALTGTTKTCKVPLCPEDVKTLEETTEAIELATGTKPALGQIASVILRMHLEVLRNATQQDSTSPLPEQPELTDHESLIIRVCRDMIDEQLKPIREEIHRLSEKL